MWSFGTEQLIMPSNTSGLKVRHTLATGTSCWRLIWIRNSPRTSPGLRLSCQPAQRAFLAGHLTRTGKTPRTPDVRYRANLPPKQSVSI